MQYEKMGAGSTYPYPNHDIDPSKKGADWCMQYAKAAFYDWSFTYPKGIFANNGGDYQKFRMYALGKQPINQYRKWLGIDQQTNNTWLTIDWSVRPIISGYRDRAISRLMKQDMGIIATPIDMLAKAELDEYIADIKAKLAVRELIEQTNQEIAQHPLISIQPGEPLDVEELEMRVQLGEQFNRSRDAEMAIELGMYENNYKGVRRMWYEDLFDYGVAGYREWLGDDNKAKFRKVNLENVVTNFCRKGDFSDLIHAGELIDVPLVDLATLTNDDGSQMFSEQELQEFASSIAGQFGNPAMLGRSQGWLKPYDKFKCKVLDIEFKTYNRYTYRDVTDENGRQIFYQEEDNSRGNGKARNKYQKKTYEFVYKCKWIVGTDKVYDWGMCYDQKRSINPKDKAKTELSFKFFAYNFYEMKAQGSMERLIPYLDDYQLTMLKIQNFKNRAVPSGWWIDLDALENVALSKGGADMQPKELLQMFFETGVLVGRSKDAQGNPNSPNWKPVIPIENTAASELAMFYQDLINTIAAIERMTGYNDITSGNPNPKTLTSGYELANISTNDALYPLAFAENNLTERLASDVLCRMQQGVKKGDITGHAPYNGALNNNLLQFIKVSPTIALREYGIMLQEKTTDDQKMWLLQQLQQDIANGLLDTSDAVMIINTHNIKQAQTLLAYKVGKNKKAMQQMEMQKIQMNNEGAKEAAMVAQQMKMQEFKMKFQHEKELKEMDIYLELEKKKMDVAASTQNAQVAGMAKVETQHAANQGKAVLESIKETKQQQ